MANSVLYRSELSLTYVPGISFSQAKPDLRVMDKTKVAIVGMGTVGTGVARLLLDHGDRTARHAGRILWLEQVVVQDAAKPRDCELPKGVLSNDLSRITGNKEIKAIAHLVGGLEP